jgi:PAS domain S-box-containing protein
LAARVVGYPRDVCAAGVELEAFGSLRALRSALETDEVAALVLDVANGGHGALDLLRDLRARGSRAPALILAELGDAEAAQRAHALGGCTVLARESATRALVGAALREQLALAEPAPADASRAPAMLFKTDARGAFTHFTQRFLAYVGLGEVEASGEGWLARVHEDDRGELRAALADGLEGAHEVAADFRVGRPEAGWRWTRLRAFPGCDAAGAFAGFTGSLAEIDDLVTGLDAARAELTRLEFANRELEELAFAGAHDLQEPLRSLEHALQGALLGGSSDLALALRQVGHMREVLRDLVHYAGSTQVRVTTECADLSQALEWAVENLRPALVERAVEVKVETLARVTGDPIQLARVFQNLLSNAVRFSGDATPMVTIRAESRERDVLVSVRDNGIGIPAEHHETIFRVFERLHGPDLPGTGMGLAISRRIVERHGGRIWVESEPGSGATFYFTLPLASA